MIATTIRNFSFGTFRWGWLLLALTPAICPPSALGKGETEVLLKEDWNSGAKLFNPDPLSGEILAHEVTVDPKVWSVHIGSKSSKSTCRVVQIEAGDWAMRLQSSTEVEEAEAAPRFQTKGSYSRGDNLRCTFKIWIEESLEDDLKSDQETMRSLSGGFWVCDPEDPMLNHLEAGIEFGDTPRFVQRATGGGESRVDLSTPFSEALKGSLSKRKALILRIWLGDETGAKLEWSLDRGKTWTEEFDTRGESGKSHSEVAFGFRSGARACFVDDISLIKDSEKE